ncbi:NAD(P)/FAD-dependent oxidoreductase [Nocardioides sp. WS12]|uniref:NAD(P)/FAD-dependent oxidoreductase n=1 Tax=Nocardioides sp. WS12 TaxID=2486272 RepID=UPI0015F9024B|nr:NAD(P)/FAD-dependent oxidoreductase [Nocardioides sp. WS12]
MTESEKTVRVEQADVVIVGARCAGSAAAVPLARAGHKVVVIDKARFPSDTMSTHVLVPNGVQELQLMGALPGILALNPTKVRRLTLHDGDLDVEERFRPFMGIDYGVCVPRDLQDQVLVEAARAAGADVRERTAMSNVVWRHGRAVGIVCRTKDDEYEIQAKLVIGADGRKSNVAGEVGSYRPYRASANGRGFAFRYVDDPLGDAAPKAYEIYRFNGHQILVLPSAPAGRTLVVNMTACENIAAYKADPEGAWAALIDEDPVLSKRMSGATNMSSIRTTTDLSSYYRASTGPGWALAGDAGHFKDPTTGNGMRDALKFGRLLGEAAATTLDRPTVLDAALQVWEAARDRDTISTYHWGNRESRPGASTALVREVLRTFAGSDEPDLSDTFNRARPIEAIITPKRMVTGLARVLRSGPDARRGLLHELRTELPLEWGSRRHRLLDGFRSTRPTATERSGWDVGTARESSWRHASDPVVLLRDAVAPDAHRA